METAVDKGAHDDKTRPSIDVVILGSGSWGTAAAALIASNTNHVTIVARRDEVAAAINATHRNPARLTNCELPTNVSATTDVKVCAKADAIIVATPSAYLHDLLLTIRPYVANCVPICLLTKGVDAEGRPLTALAAELLSDPVSVNNSRSTNSASKARRSTHTNHTITTIDSPAAHRSDDKDMANISTARTSDDLLDTSASPSPRIAVLSGPNHAEEIASGMLSAGVIACDDLACATVFQHLFTSVDFRAYVTSDVIGVSLCGATKNIIAVAAGIATGIGAGDNTLAVLMTRGLAEMGRIVCACGGDSLTCMGLAGMGDLVATCTSVHSRNRSFGMALARGATLAEFELAHNAVVEGAVAVRGITNLAKTLDVEMPIASAVNAILYEGLSIAEVVASLLMRTPSEEFYSFALRERK